MHPYVDVRACVRARARVHFLKQTMKTLLLYTHLYNVIVFMKINLGLKLS
jgi:hypothetical protein